MPPRAPSPPAPSGPSRPSAAGSLPSRRPAAGAAARGGAHHPEPRAPGALTLRGVGDRLGVSRTALYRHFADKQALLDEVAAEGFRMLRDGAARGVDGAGRGRRGFDAMGLAYVRFAVTHPSHYRVMFGGVAATARGTAGEGAIARRVDRCVPGAGRCHRRPSSATGRSGRDDPHDAGALHLGDGARRRDARPRRRCCRRRPTLETRWRALPLRGSARRHRSRDTGASDRPQGPPYARRPARRIARAAGLRADETVSRKPNSTGDQVNQIVVAATIDPDPDVVVAAQLLDARRARRRALALGHLADVRARHDAHDLAALDLACPA